MSESADLLVVGAGPGGYVAAIRAAQLGLSVVVVERMETLGGTCLNIGCIPSKALLDSSELYALSRTGFAAHGIRVSGVALDLPAMHDRKRSIVRRLTGGVAALLEGRGVRVVRGIARLPAAGAVAGAGAASGEVIVNGPEGERRIRARNVVLAAGSIPVELPFLPFDGERVVSSTEALEFDSVPERLVVVGGGAIGLELGSLWSRLGSSVTVVEIMKEILPGWDLATARALRRELARQGIDFRLAHRVTGLADGATPTRVRAEGPDGAPVEIEAQKVLVAVGRRPCTGDLGLQEAGVRMEERSGRVAVDEQFRTSADGVYAIGDLVRGPMLAHKAEEEGVAVAEIIAGKPGHVNYEAIPGVVYTWPEAAAVGRTEEELTEAGVAFRRGTFRFSANGRALAMGSEAGFVKILAHAESDRILGAHIVGPRASDLIAEVVAVMEFEGTAEDIARITHAHPTLPEAVREAALAAEGRALHSLKGDT